MAAKCVSAGEYASNLLKLIFQQVSYPGFADPTATSPITTLYLSLHTASPTATGTQSSSEALYGGYARQPVARTTAGWTVTGNSVSPAAMVQFPTATSGSEQELYLGIGTAASGAGISFTTRRCRPRSPSWRAPRRK
jgi:hypothetical protein